jgi:uncharacterized protein YpmS
MSRRIRIFLFSVAGVALTVVAVLLGLYLAAEQEPAFYREAMEIDPGVLKKQSDRMLHQATALASAVKKEKSWEALFTAEQINGWLAVDMVQNHPNAMPSALHDPRVAIDSKRITFACRFENRGINTVLTLTIEPYVPEPNVVALRIVSAKAGLLPVPLGKVLERLSQAAREMQFHLEWRRTGNDPVAMLSLPPTSDDRSVRIETLRLGEGEVYVSGTTRDKPRAKESRRTVESQRVK